MLLYMKSIKGILKTLFSNIVPGSGAGKIREEGRRIKCKYCMGTGLGDDGPFPLDGIPICRYCGGSGYISQDADLE
jgi:hypothetical protein